MLFSCYCEARSAEAIFESKSEIASLRSQWQFELLNGLLLLVTPSPFLICHSNTARTLKKFPSFRGALARIWSWGREAASLSSFITFWRAMDWAVGGTPLVSTCCNTSKFSRILDNCALSLSTSVSVKPSRARGQYVIPRHDLASFIYP